MSRAIITADEYSCAPLGTVVERFKRGDIVHGRAAMFAVRAGAGEPYNPVQQVAAEAPPEAKNTIVSRKRRKPRGEG